MTHRFFYSLFTKSLDLFTLFSDSAPACKVYTTTHHRAVLGLPSVICVFKEADGG